MQLTRAEMLIEVWANEKCDLVARCPRRKLTISATRRSVSAARQQRDEADDMGVPNRHIAADLLVRPQCWSCGWQRCRLVTVRMLYRMFVRLTGWMALLARSVSQALRYLKQVRDGKVMTAWDLAR